jgi:hypothetical protein
MGNPVSVHHSCPNGKSGVGSSFLPEKINRHRITSEKINRHRITSEWGARPVTTRRARRTGPLPPGHLRTHRRMNEIIETITEARSRVGDLSRPARATCRGGGA